jgi:hypothetical protein
MWFLYLLLGLFILERIDAFVSDVFRTMQIDDAIWLVLGDQKMTMGEITDEINAKYSGNLKTLNGNVSVEIIIAKLDFMVKENYLTNEWHYLSTDSELYQFGIERRLYFFKKPGEKRFEIQPKHELQETKSGLITA